MHATMQSQLEDSHHTLLLENQLEQWPTFVCPGEQQWDLFGHLVSKKIGMVCFVKHHAVFF